MLGLSSTLKIPLLEVELAVASLSQRPYLKYLKKKPNGGFRWIYARCSELKIIQARLKDYFNRWPLDNSIYGFRRGRSIKDNALTHYFEKCDRVPRWKLKLDLQNAFPSVKRQYLQKVLEELFRKRFCDQENGDLRLQAWVELLLDLVTYDNQLIQGSPASPALLNRCLVYANIPRELKMISKDREQPFWFSIYADDITISSQRTKIKRFELARITEVIQSHTCFQVNTSKTRLTNRKSKAHQITGVVLAEIPTSSDKFIIRPTLAQSLTRSYRGKIHRATTLLNNDRWPNKKRDGFTVHQILGMISHANFICQVLPSGLRTVIPEFREALWQYAERNNLYFSF